MSIKDVNKELMLNQKYYTEKISLSITENIIYHKEKMHNQLLTDYYKYLNVFDCSQINQLSSHCLYNYKIKLISDTAFSQS